MTKLEQSLFSLDIYEITQGVSVYKNSTSTSSRHKLLYLTKAGRPTRQVGNKAGGQQGRWATR
jgi:hypothetical protein